MEELVFDLYEPIHVDLFFIKEAAYVAIDEELYAVGDASAVDIQKIKSLKWSEKTLETSLKTIGVNLEDLKLDVKKYKYMIRSYVHYFELYKNSIISYLPKNKVLN